MSSLSDLSPCCIKLQCLNSSQVLDLILSFPIFLKISNLEIFETHQGTFWSSGWDFPKENFEVSSLIESFFGSRGCPIWKSSPFYSGSENHLERNALATPRFNIYFLIFWIFFSFLTVWSEPPQQIQCFHKANAPVMSLKIHILEREGIRHFTLTFVVPEITDIRGNIFT